MKERVIRFVQTYILLVCIFMLQKPMFMLYHKALYQDVPWWDWLRVMGHGLPLDFSLSGYLTALPGFFLIFSAWTLSKGLYRLCCFYFGLVSLLLALIFIVDLGLYSYWGFRLDATPLFYFFSSPGDALASITLWQVFAGVFGIAAYAAILYGLFYGVLLRKSAWKQMKLPYRRLSVSSVLLLLTGVLFIPIRGGFTVSTMNVGKVYFSNELRLNHAAINPVFSLMESLTKQRNFGEQYRFMKAAEAGRIYAQLLDPAVPGSGILRPDSVSHQADSLRSLFNTKKPDVLLVVLESFSSHLMSVLGGQRGIAVQLDSLSHEGILFTHFYANSFRTDRGLVSILSGYPAQPTTSIMKYPRKTQSLPSIAASLKKAGYRAEYYYGGDADFTNMRSYLVSSGFERIVSDQDFPVSERLSKWGVHDHLVFARLLEDLKEETSQDTPRFRVLQTSSSHEPFEVPYRRLKNDKLNAFAYTDNCVGEFVKQFRQMPQWKNTVIVFVPDHLGAWPENMDNLSVERFQIPLLMVGGAVKGPRRIGVYGSQQDLAATLLAQLGLSHGEFQFSKDLMDPYAPHFAFFTIPDAWGMVTADNRLVYDCQSDAVVLDEGKNKGKHLQAGKAYLQKLYDDIAER